MAQRRLTRKERQAHTRARLMRSAATVAARRGLERASLDEVAEEAGFTKGAVYANFRSKEDLFLAILDERFAERVEELDRVLAAGGTPEEQARRAARDFMRAIEAEAEWERLFFEFALYASRNEAFRKELVKRYRGLRQPPKQVAAMTFAMANGIALERLLEPEAVPDDLAPTMMATFFRGLRAQAGGGLSEGARAR
jgi:AcrR family transcriptional regulator